ncbi:hypothetical protein AAC387_Pa02g0140 [Persea americana]
MEENTELEAVECNQSNSVAINIYDAGNHGSDVAATVDDLTKSMKDELTSKPYKPAYSATILRVPDEMREDDKSCLQSQGRLYRPISSIKAKRGAHGRTQMALSGKIPRSETSE